VAGLAGDGLRLLADASGVADCHRPAIVGLRERRRVYAILWTEEYRDVHLQHRREVVDAPVLLRDVAEHEGVPEGDPPVEMHGGRRRVAPRLAGLVVVAGGDRVIDGVDFHHVLEGGRVGHVDDVDGGDADVGGAEARVVGVHAHPHGQLLGQHVEGDGIVAQPPDVLEYDVALVPQEPGGLDVAVFDGEAEVDDTGAEQHHHHGDGERQRHQGRCNDARQSQATESASVIAGGHYR